MAEADWQSEWNRLSVIFKNDVTMANAHPPPFYPAMRNRIVSSLMNQKALRAFMQLGNSLSSVQRRTHDVMI